MIKWIKDIWHGTRAQMLKRKIHRLDLMKDEQKVYALRLKRSKHLNYFPGDVRTDKRFSSVIDDEEQTVHVVSSYYDYDDDGEPTGMTKSEGMFHKSLEKAKTTPGAVID